jgi:hypothetical protein
MKRSRQVRAGVIAALAVVGAVLIALKVAPARPSADVGTAEAPAVTENVATGVVDTIAEVDPTALAALERMGSYLRTLKAFQLHADVVTEDVRLDGQKVQTVRAVDLVARRPDRLHAEVTNAQQRRLFFYNGKTFTLWAPRSRYYATIAAPSTIEKLADELERKHGVNLPLVDLFRWGTPAANVAAIKSAIDVGPSQIEGVTCEQYAFQQDGLDWQVWIQLGDHPLPRRIVITTLTDEARPQHMATYTWNLAPSYNDATFTFETPKDAKKIPLASVKPIQATSKTATP